MNAFTSLTDLVIFAQVRQAVINSEFELGVRWRVPLNGIRCSCTAGSKNFWHSAPVSILAYPSCHSFASAIAVAQPRGVARPAFPVPEATMPHEYSWAFREWCSMNELSPDRCEDCKEASVRINRGGSPSSSGQDSSERDSRDLIPLAQCPYCLHNDSIC